MGAYLVAGDSPDEDVGTRGEGGAGLFLDKISYRFTWAGPALLLKHQLQQHGPVPDTFFVAPFAPENQILLEASTELVNYR